MLTTLDETMMHQIPETFDVTRISDHRFYDRIWVNGHGEHGDRFMMGMGAYKNMNVFDGFFCVAKGDKQYNLRLSRSFHPVIDDMVVGPLSVKIIEPLQELDICLCAGDEYGHSCELKFSGVAPAHEEAHHFRRYNGRIVQDYRRYDQLGKINGWILLGGEKIEVVDWFGLRDHSWGVRPGVGGFDTTGLNILSVESPKNAPDPAVYGRLFLWLAFQTKTLTGQFLCLEDGNGHLMSLDGHVRHHGDGQLVKVRSLHHDLTFIAGTRILESGNLNVGLENGEILSIQTEALHPPSVYKGFGYDKGYKDELGLGVPRGNLLESDVYTLRYPDDVLLPDGRVIHPQFRDNSVRLTVNGEPGMGHFPTYNSGFVKRYGLDKKITN